MPRAGRWQDKKGYKHPATNPQFRKPYSIFRKNWLAKNPLCAVPGCGRAATQLDHIVPLKEFGKVTLGQLVDPMNVQGLCFDHHAAKTRRENMREQQPDFCLCGVPHRDGKPWCREKACWERWRSARPDGVGEGH